MRKHGSALRQFDVKKVLSGKRGAEKRAGNGSALIQQRHPATNGARRRESLVAKLCDSVVIGDNVHNGRHVAVEERVQTGDWHEDPLRSKRRIRPETDHHFVGEKDRTNQIQQCHLAHFDEPSGKTTQTITYLNVNRKGVSCATFNLK